MEDMNNSAQNCIDAKGGNNEKETDEGNAPEENKFLEYCAAAEKCREEYTLAYREMLNELRSEHLKGFAASLLECEICVLGDDEVLVKDLRDMLMNSLQGILDNLWEQFDVSNRLASLEMLKEECKRFEGTSWDMEKLNPIQRTLPLRMRFKNWQIRRLEKQIAHQNAQLEEILNINKEKRDQIHNINEERLHVKENIINYSKCLQEKKTQIIQMACDILDSCGDDKDIAL